LLTKPVQATERLRGQIDGTEGQWGLRSKSLNKEPRVQMLTGQGGHTSRVKERGGRPRGSGRKAKGCKARFGKTCPPVTAHMGENRGRSRWNTESSYNTRSSRVAASIFFTRGQTSKKTKQGEGRNPKFASARQKDPHTSGNGGETKSSLKGPGETAGEKKKKKPGAQRTGTDVKKRNASAAVVR